MASKYKNTVHPITSVNSKYKQTLLDSLSSQPSKYMRMNPNYAAKDKSKEKYTVTVKKANLVKTINALQSTMDEKSDTHSQQQKKRGVNETEESSHKSENSSTNTSSKYKKSEKSDTKDSDTPSNSHQSQNSQSTEDTDKEEESQKKESQEEKKDYFVQEEREK